MPNLNQYGVSIDVGDVGDRQSPSAPTPPTAIAPIQVRKYVRNGKAPSAELQNALNGAANYAALYRSKEVFSASVVPGTGSLTATTEWRFACHTGAYSHALFGMAALLNPYGAGATQAKATLKIYNDVTESTLVGSADFFYGAGTSGTGFGWRQAKYPVQWIDGLAADTDYYGRWDLSGSPFLLAACVWDMQSMTENYNGYLTQSLTSHSPVFGVDRSNVHTLLKNVWKRGGAKVLNYVVLPGGYPVGSDGSETGSISNTTTSTTYTNILDRTSTTISASTPGWTVDMRNKDRVSQTSGVPCVLKAFGRTATGGVGGTGSVTMFNSAGTSLGSVTISGSATNQWYSTSVNIPAALDKLDIHFKSSSGNRVFLYAVTLYEYET